MSEDSVKAGSSHRMSVAFLVGETSDEASSLTPRVQEEGSGDGKASGSAKETSLQCRVCHAQCKFKSELLYHDYMHGLNRDITVCQECELGFTKMFTYRSHIKCVHQKIKRYKCGECGKGFYFKKDLPKHQAAVHAKLKPFSCTTCGKSFAKKEHLQRHARTAHGTG
uniref:C2H2-type domain-containing protein n=1 Tax=Rhodosorus marinus TaxID=101924 RepID=A0A7S3E7Q7_9RHOD|mmetsp:Transcript_12204/g.50491  ORF Transcript_12204/g.50491 Transcript_12204/m.50491 type:complete len:167 (+) Transcript_12204:137-637(+)